MPKKSAKDITPKKITKAEKKKKSEEQTRALVQRAKDNFTEIKREISAAKQENFINGEYLPNFIFRTFIDRIDPIEYCQDILRNHYPESKKYLHQNQIDLIRAACNPQIKQVAGLMARQTGKTESIASMGGYFIDNYPQMKVGIFTPRLQQAEVSIGRLSTFFQMNEDRLNHKIVKITKDKIELDNNSYITAVSASDQSNIEGLTFDIMILDEAQKISNYTWSERIAPMGGATNAKIIKIGTPKTKNHFYDSVEGKGSDKWFVVRRDWTQCAQLWALGAVYLPDRDTGEIHPYSKYVLTQLMPKALKQEYFPNNPEVWTEGGMSIEDFRTQYMLEFIDGAGKFLDTPQVESLMSGEFEWLEKGQLGELYVAGIDFAGSNPDGDNTHISVLRINPDGTKHKVFAKEFSDMPYPQQIYEIANMFAGFNPKFQVKKIFADYTGCGAAVVQTLQQEFGMKNLEGIVFNSRDRFTNSGMNLKNIMYAKFKTELDSGRIQYPSKERFLNSRCLSAGSGNIGFFHKMIGEWADLEYVTGTTVNKKIEAPLGYHDDVCDADVLANFAALEGLSHRAPKARFGRVSRF